MGPWWHIDNTVTSAVGCSNPSSYGKVGSCLLMVRSLPYRTLTNCMYWYPLPIKLLRYDLSSVESDVKTQINKYHPGIVYSFEVMYKDKQAYGCDGNNITIYG